MLLEVQVVQEMAEYPDQHRHDYFLFSAPNGQSLIQVNVHKEISEPLLKYIYIHMIFVVSPPGFPHFYSSFAMWQLLNQSIVTPMR